MYGWIKLYRSMLENFLWKEERVFSRAEAWLDLLMTANHEKRSVLIGNQLVTVNAGDNLSSISALSNRWGWSRKKVSIFLQLLKDEGMLNYKCTSKYTLVTILKWGLYQQELFDKEHQTNINRTSNAHQTHTNKNEKNDKNDKNKINNNPPISPQGEDGEERFNQFWKAYPKKFNKQSAKKAWNKLKPDDGLLQIMLSSLDQQKKTDQWTKDNGQYIPYPATWLNNRRWEDEDCSVKVPEERERTCEEIIRAAQGKWAGYNTGDWY